MESHDLSVGRKKLPSLGFQFVFFSTVGISGKAALLSARNASIILTCPCLCNGMECARLDALAVLD